MIERDFILFAKSCKKFISWGGVEPPLFFIEEFNRRQLQIFHKWICQLADEFVWDQEKNIFVLKFLSKVLTKIAKIQEGVYR